VEVAHPQPQLGLRIRCPPPQRIMALLEAKARLAKELYWYDREKRRWVLNLSRLSTAATRRFGRLQRVDLSIPPPPEAYNAMLETVPGLTACYHKFLYETQGKLENSIMSIEGEGGRGKSTLAYYLTLWLGGEFIPPTDDVVERLYRIVDAGRWVPIIVLDDIGTVFGKYWVFNPEDYQIVTPIFEALEYVRDWTGLLLMTTRSFPGIAKKLRELTSLNGVVKRIVLHGEYIVDIIVWYNVHESRVSRKPVYVDILWPGVPLPKNVFSMQIRERREKARRLLRRALEAKKKRGEAEGGKN